ncbi:MAG: peptidoglycan DD-metalloendopeptidase family protein [Coxiellaceae bacterium]|nr:peptidoglycan DD-metalloendopeptidase family protein [Coxiellaceae bacterium]
MKITNRFIIFFLCALLVISTSQTLAASSQKRLKKINQQIARIKDKLDQDTDKLNQQQTNLATIESHLSSLNEQLQQNDSQLKSTQIQLFKLQQQNQDYKKQLEQQQQLLAQQIASSYQLGEQPLLKMVLNQQNPEHMQRMFMYYKYFNQQRIDTIKQWKDTIAKLDNNLVEISQHNLQLKALQQKQATEKQQYSQSLKQRQRVIAQLNRKINSKQKRLQRLLRNKRALQKIINQAQTTPVNSYQPNQAFAKLRGQLHWPTVGPISKRYGTAIDNSELTWDGVLIKANSGQDVRAIADGRVIFAKWLAGYGLLIIVNHGNGYMTLYGRNQSLFKRVGDKVHAGEAIASVGKTGGYNNSGLYFALRHNARPLNPSKWCQKA